MKTTKTTATKRKSPSPRSAPTTAKTGYASSEPAKPKPKNINFSRDVVLAGEEKMLELMRVDVNLSWSALVEVALLELFKRPDFVATVKGHGLGLRRK